MLENKFKTLCQHFSKDKVVINKLWEEIFQSYSTHDRHYHNLNHLQYVYHELESMGITPLLAFTTFYHDIIYNPRNTNNEKESALLAKERLIQLSVPKTLNKKIFQLILETKTHKASSPDNTLFLDADLSILGSTHELYTLYTQNVRKEYSIYNN